MPQKPSTPTALSLEQAAKACPLLENQDDREAWVACCTRRFLPMARRLAGRDQLVEDVLQDSWARVLTHACQYRGGAPACAWVGKIVANCAKDCRDDLRSRRQREGGAPPEGIADPALNPEVSAQRREMLALLHAIVDALPPAYREVYALRYTQELSTSATARRLGISDAAVSTRLNRSVAMIKKRLAVHLQAKERHD